MKAYIKTIILIALGLAVLIPLASTFPDGLETVAETVNIEEYETMWPGLMPDYSISMIENSYVSTFFAGMLGTLMVLAVAFFVGKAMAVKRRHR